MSTPRRLTVRRESDTQDTDMEERREAFAKEHNITVLKAGFLIDQAKMTDAYKQYALSNMRSTRPDLRERNKFAVMLAHEKIISAEEEKWNKTDSIIHSISPFN